jgi:hypothetical protein
MIWLYLSLYFIIPVLGILISGRSVTIQGWIVMLLFWPIAWIFTGPEELP